MNFILSFNISQMSLCILNVNFFQIFAGKYININFEKKNGLKLLFWNFSLLFPVNIPYNEILLFCIQRAFSVKKTKKQTSMKFVWMSLFIIQEIPARVFSKRHLQFCQTHFPFLGMKCNLLGFAHAHIFTQWHLFILHY